MDSFTAVISRFGTVERFAEEVGVNPRTAYSWHHRNTIPHDMARRVVQAAQDRGFEDITLGLLAKLAETKAPERPASPQSEAAA